MSQLTLRVKTIFALTLLMLLNTACSSESGGECNYIDQQVMARVSTVYDEFIKLETMDGKEISLDRQQFSNDVERNDYYQLMVRRHTSGGCNPYAIRSITKAEIANVILSPSDHHAYAAMFIVDAARNCAHHLVNSHCQDDLALDSSFDLAQLPLFADIDPRSLSYCSAQTMNALWPALQAPVEQTNTRVIACLNDDQGQQIALEFIVSDDQSKLSLRKVY